MRFAFWFWAAVVAVVAVAVDGRGIWLAMVNVDGVGGALLWLFVLGVAIQAVEWLLEAGVYLAQFAAGMFTTGVWSRRRRVPAEPS